MLKEETQSKLDMYVEAYDRIKQRIGDERVSSVILQELAKDIRIARPKSDGFADNPVPATDKQLAFLRRLGKDVDGPLTKQQASALIDDATEYREKTVLPARIP